MPDPRDATAAGEGARQRLRGRGVLAFAIGLAGVVAAIVLALPREKPAERITITAGPEGATRALVAHKLATEIEAHGTTCAVIAAADTQAEIESLRSGGVDFAMVSAVYRGEHRDPHVRIVAPLQVEALHLLVKPELADRVSDGLGGLRGQEVDLGPAASTGASLAADVLAFAGIEPATATRPDGFVARHVEIGDLEAAADRGDRAALPAAIFHLATIPSLVAQKLVREADYVLIALPFAEAFRLQGVLAANIAGGAGLDRRNITEAVIPPFLYETKPAVPATPLPTLGVRLLLLANDRVSDATVERILAAVFDTRFARLLHPALGRSLLTATPPHELHHGTLAYLARREPAITGDAVNDLSNSLSIVGALVGGGVFVFQGWRQRQRARRDRLVADHLRRVAGIERRIVEVELAASLDLDTLIAVQRELLTLKSEVLDGFTAGALDDASLLSGLLDPINAARDHVGDLLLHVRGQLEDQAQDEGRDSSAVWKETAAESDEGGAAS